MQEQQSVGRDLLRAEAGLARLEGILLADPALARRWRVEAAFVEAAASVGLEDVRIPEAAVVMRLTTGNAAGLDARATEMAGQILSVLKRPPDLDGDPVEGIRRIEAATRVIGEAPDPTDRLEDGEIVTLLERAEVYRDLPLLSGIMAAAAYAHLSRRSSPAAERLILTCVEGQARRLRGAERGSRRAMDDDLLLSPVTASWTALPASALSRGGFRIWSPLSGIPTLLSALADQGARELGQLGTLRHEVATLEALVARARGRSRLPDLAALLRTRPVLTSALVIEKLGVTRRTALALIGELADAGALVEITARRAARFWATPSLGARLRQRPPAGLSPRHALAPEQPQDREPDRSEIRQSRIRDGFDDDRLDRIMAELDAAMAGVDKVVQGIERRRAAAQEDE